MPLNLYYFCSDGKRELPNEYTSVSFSLDNSVVSALSKEHEWKSSPDVMKFRRYLRKKELGTMSLFIIPAILESKLFRSNESFEDIFKLYRTTLELILGQLSYEPDYNSFMDFTAKTVARLLELNFVIAKAYQLYDETPGDTEKERIKRRLWLFSDWEGKNPHTGAGGPAGLAVYSALANNVEVRKALGISGDFSFDKLMNGSWDLLQWDFALNNDLASIFNSCPFIPPVSAFVTADRRLASAFDAFSNKGYGGNVAVWTRGLTKDMPVSYQVRLLLGKPAYTITNYVDFYRNAVVRLETQLDVLREISPLASLVHTRCVQLYEYTLSSGSKLPRKGTAVPLNF